MIDHSFNALARLQTKEGICEYLGGISSTTYDQWLSRGIVPGPVAGTKRYDVRQHDRVLDRLAGIAPIEALSPLERWEAEIGLTDLCPRRR